MCLKKFKKKVSRVSQECFNEVLFLHGYHRSYLTRRTAFLNIKISLEEPFNKFQIAQHTEFVSWHKDLFRVFLLWGRGPARVNNLCLSPYSLFPSPLTLIIEDPKYKILLPTLPGSLRKIGSGHGWRWLMVVVLVV